MTRQETVRWLHRTGTAAKAIIVVVVLLVGLAAITALFIKQAIHRITIDPIALSAAAHEAVRATLAKGTPDQKVQTIRALEQLRSAGQPFVPALIVASRESDPDVRAAALHALVKIDPTD